MRTRKRKKPRGDRGFLVSGLRRLGGLLWQVWHAHIHLGVELFGNLAHGVLRAVDPVHGLLMITQPETEPTGNPTESQSRGRERSAEHGSFDLSCRRYSDYRPWIDIKCVTASSTSGMPIAIPTSSAARVFLSLMPRMRPMIGSDGRFQGFHQKLKRPNNEPHAADHRQQIAQHERPLGDAHVLRMVEEYPLHGDTSCKPGPFSRGLRPE